MVVWLDICKVWSNLDHTQRVHGYMQSLYWIVIPGEQQQEIKSTGVVTVEEGRNVKLTLRGEWRWASPKALDIMGLIEGRVK